MAPRPVILAKMDEIFRIVATRVSRMIGSVWSALIIIAAILGSGFYFKFSQDYMYTAGSVASLLALLSLVFLQKSQNHSDRATHLKLDELVTALQGARDAVVSVEHQTAREMDDLHDAREAIAERVDS